MLDIAKALDKFISGCYIRHINVTLSNQGDIKKIRAALYGEDGHPEGSILDMKRQMCRLAKIMLVVGSALGTILVSAMIWLTNHALARLTSG